MRKILLLLLLFQICNLQAQERDNVGHRVGPWSMSAHNCFKGLSWKVRKSYYLDNSDKYTNEIEIKNNYTSSTITFSYNMSENSNETTTRYRKTLGPGKTYTSTYCPNVHLVTFYVTEVCFNSNNTCDKTCYALCDNGTPNIPADCGKKNNSSSTSTSNKPQQNDLSEYNRSKAELDRQIQEENNRRQQQANDLNNRNQQFVNVYNEGVSLGNVGRYAEATSKYQQAIGLATNESDRQTAQNAYNKISKANTQTEALNQVSSSLTELARTLEAAKEEKRLKQEQERIAQEQLQREREEKAARETENMEIDWQNSQKYANLNNKESYKKAIEIMLPYAINKKINGYSLNIIGNWYRNLKDYENAMKWYIEASSLRNDADAMSNIATLHLNGLGVEKNKGFALTYFQKSCINGYEEGCQNFNKIREELSKITKTSNKETRSEFYYVAETYYIEKNYQEALKYYLKAYENETIKHWSTPLIIANMYFDKNQLNDITNSAKWYETVINLMENDPIEKNNIGKQSTFDDKYTDVLFNYAYLSKSTNGKLAIESYQKAVRDGYTGAYTQIGSIYELGQGGIEIDWKQAQFFYAKDADKKAAKAMYYLGQLYEKGGPNLEKNKSESKKWYKIACKTDKKYCK